MVRALTNLVAPRLRWAPALLLGTLVPACGEAGGAGLARATVDTLANGTVRVSSEGPTGWRPGRGWRLSEALRITGEEGTESELINPASLAVDAAGRIWVVDQKPAVIKVYAADGRLIRTVGREGAGPGEFRVGFIAAAGGAMVLHDPQAARTTVFDTSGTYLRSWASHCCYWSAIQVDRQRRAYIPGMWSGDQESAPGSPWYRYSLEGELLDTVFIPRRGDARYWTVRAGTGRNQMSMSMSIPFTPRIFSGFDPEGGFVYGWAGGYELAVSRTGTDSVLVFDRPWTPEPVTEQARHDTVEAMISSRSQIDESVLRDAFKLEELPATRPAFEGVAVAEDGHVWVRLGPDPAGGLLFDVFAPSGAWLGQVTSPLVFSPYTGVWFGAAEIVVLVEDEDGRPAVVKLRIDKSPA